MTKDEVEFATTKDGNPAYVHVDVQPGMSYLIVEIDGHEEIHIDADEALHLAQMLVERADLLSRIEKYELT